MAGAGAVVLALVGAAPAGAADANTVHIKSVFAKPIVATRSADSDVNERYLCTPEPDNQYLYGTDGAFNENADSSAPSATNGGLITDPGYLASNFPSVSEQLPALQAGVSNDLCFGFTLTPNVEPALTGSNDPVRYNNPVNPAPDVPATHVDNGSGQPVQGDDMDEVSVKMPEGFLGDPDSGPTCTDKEFGVGNYKSVNTAACGPAQVGTAFVRLSIYLGSSSVTQLVAGGSPNNTSPNGLGAGGVVYNLAHGPNELARLGVNVNPAQNVAPSKFVIALSATPDGRVTTTTHAPRSVYLKSGINSTITDVNDPGYGQPNPGAATLPIYVESFAVRAWGKKADHPSLTKDFAQWGTDCTTPLSASAAVTTFGGVKSEGTSDAFNLTGCDQLPFNPSITVDTTEKKPAVPTGVHVKVAIDQTKSGDKLPALLKDAQVTLPAGLEIGAQAGSRAGGLKLCSAAQFAKDSAADNTCPAGSAAGTVKVISPLQSRPIVGTAYLGEQKAVGDLPALYLQMSPEGATATDAPRFKLVGSVTVDEQGHITTTFNDAPQLRFSSLELTFPGGPDALFSTPRKCDTFTGTSKLTSSASTTPKTVETSLTIDQDCGTPGFSPSMSFVPSSTAVGARSATTVTIDRPDRSPWLSNAKVSLPPGFLSDLTIPTECAAGAAATGDCPESSRIATVTTTAGVGAQPISLQGKMYLSERPAGAVAGATIVVPAKIGDLDLGNVVVPARIDLNPNNAQLTLATSIPTRFRNIALNMRSVVVALDRENFPLNPTACGPLNATGELTGDGGETATTTSAVTFTGCAARGLQPTAVPTLSGELKPKGHPTLSVSITARPGDTNLSATSVTMPEGISSDPNNLQAGRLCATDLWTAGNCPAATKTGSVSAKVAITNDTITGDVYLVKVPGKVLPGLGMNFTGRYAVRLLGTVAVNRELRLAADFASIPDIPLTKLDLTVNGGAGGPLQLSPDACTKDSSWDFTFGGQGGQKYSSAVAYPCANPPAPTYKWTAKSGLKITLAAPTNQTLKSAKFTLPKGFKLTKSASKRKKNVKLTVPKGTSVTAKYSSTSISLTGKSGKTPKTITVTVKPGAYTAPKSLLKKGKLKKGKKISVKSRIVSSGGNITSNTTSVKVG